jgi:hypothetical protein
MHKTSVGAAVALVAAVASGCAIGGAGTLPPDKAALESFAAAWQSSAPRADKSSDPGRPSVVQTDPPPMVGLLGPFNAPAPGGVFTPTSAWAGWIDPTTYVQVWAGDQPEFGGGGLMMVMRRPGIGDGAHLDPNAEPTASYVPPPTKGGPLTITAVRDGKLVIRNPKGTEFLFDPVAGGFVETP